MCPILCILTGLTHKTVCAEVGTFMQELSMARNSTRFNGLSIIVLLSFLSSFWCLGMIASIQVVPCHPTVAPLDGQSFWTPNRCCSSVIVSCHLIIFISLTSESWCELFFSESNSMLVHQTCLFEKKTNILRDFSLTPYDPFNFEFNAYFYVHYPFTRHLNHLL